MPDIYFNDHEIERIGTAFIARTLPKPEWTHAGHFAAVLYLLRHRPDWDVSTAMPPLIRAYNEATGVANTDNGGYHETITQASIRAARHVLITHGLRGEAVHRVVNALLVEFGDGPLRLVAALLVCAQACFRWRRAVAGWRPN